MKKIPFFSDLDEHLLKQIVKNIATKKRSAIVATFAPKMHQVFQNFCLLTTETEEGTKQRNHHSNSNCISSISKLLLCIPNEVILIRFGD